MPGDPAAYARWLAYARQDLAAATREASSPQSVPRIACGLSQQAAEKALKAALILCGVTPPRQHNLDPLRNLLPEDWPIRSELPDLASLTFWSIEARYPSDFDEPTLAQARDALALAGAVIAAVERDAADHLHPTS